MRVVDRRRKVKRRHIYSVEQLNRIFNAPLYTGCVDDERGCFKIGDKFPRRVRFWLPLIALFTGMRIEEICQLDVADIGFEEGIYYFNIIEYIEGEEIEKDKALKTDGSWRKIPVHAELKKIGFLEYVQEIKSSGAVKLFPDIRKSSKDKYAANLTKWYARFLGSLELKTKSLVFHSYRHTFTTAMRNAGVPEEYHDWLGGWVTERMSRKYGEAPNIKVLNEQHSKIEYLGLDLSHLYYDAWKARLNRGSRAH